MASLPVDVRTRLRRAALALFAERGYDRTAAAEIAARAGVTERTFFRHFADKREVMFDGAGRVSAALLAAVADAAPDLGPMATLRHAFRALQPMLDESRAYLRARHALIAATPALHERELAKIDAQVDMLAAALRERGVERGQAALAARVGMSANLQATLDWLQDPSGPAFGVLIDSAFEELRALVAAENGSGL